jgi:glycosyltransferase involved in cell wall biosynthesis
MPRVKLSVIIPAFNEAARIEGCLQSLFAALKSCARDGLTSEIIVVDNNSTDATADLARKAGVRVVFEPINHIARARNAGAAVATGDWLLFLDADTLFPAATLADALAAMQNDRVVGGGSALDFGKLTFAARLLVLLCNLVVRLFKMTPGCFLFCRGDAFRAVGGFDEKFFAGEDAEMGKALKRWGRERGLRLAILHRHPPLTSNRKFQLYGVRKIFVLLVRFVFTPRTTMTDKRYLDVFYDGRR